MMFNPITNQPMDDYKIKKEQIPREYNPYKNPYSDYQGHP